MDCLFLDGDFYKVEELLELERGFQFSVLNFSFSTMKLTTPAVFEMTGECQFNSSGENIPAVGDMGCGQDDQPRGPRPPVGVPPPCWPPGRRHPAPPVGMAARFRCPSLVRMASFLRRLPKPVYLCLPNLVPFVSLFCSTSRGPPLLGDGEG